MHIGMNMFTMYSFGYYLEKSFGTIRFFFINLAICIVGGILFTIYYYLMYFMYNTFIVYINLIEQVIVVTFIHKQLVIQVYYLD